MQDKTSIVLILRNILYITGAKMREIGELCEQLENKYG